MVDVSRYIRVRGLVDVSSILPRRLCIRSFAYKSPERADISSFAESDNDAGESSLENEFRSVCPSG